MITFGFGTIMLAFGAVLGFIMGWVLKRDLKKDEPIVKKVKEG